MSGAEQRPGKPNGVDRKPWESKISPKTPHSLLAETSSVSLIPTLAGDIIANARELAPEVDWTEILSGITYSDRRGNRYMCKTGIEMSFAQNLRLVAGQMGWGMDSPEVVYMSGLYFCRAIDGFTAGKSKKIKEASDPKRKFVSEEFRAATIAKREGEIEKFKSFKAVIEDSLRRYARQKLPRWKTYSKNLQKLLDSLLSGKPEKADAMLVALSVGKALEPQAQLQPQAS